MYTCIKYNNDEKLMKDCPMRKEDGHCLNCICYQNLNSDDVDFKHLTEETAQKLNQMFESIIRKIKSNNQQKRIMYILQRDDGKFYWKGNNSSQWGYKDGFENAYLFATEKGAKSRMGYGCDVRECKIRMVVVTLIGEKI